MRQYVLVTLATLTSITAAMPQGAPGPDANAPRARTVNGTVAGVALPSGVHAFRGLPYAAPPVRALRWRPPQPAPNWQGVRLADRFANQCMQARVFGDMMFRNAGVSEDCLYLNVWTPGARSASRPACRIG